MNSPDLSREIPDLILSIFGVLTQECCSECEKPKFPQGMQAGDETKIGWSACVNEQCVAFGEQKASACYRFSERASHSQIDKIDDLLKAFAKVVEFKSVQGNDPHGIADVRRCGHSALRWNKYPVHLGEEGTEQFRVTTYANGAKIGDQKIHDPFIRSTTTLRGFGWAWRALFGIKVQVCVNGSDGASRAIMTLNPHELEAETREIQESRKRDSEMRSYVHDLVGANGEKMRPE